MMSGTPNNPSICIIGAGFSGLCSAIRLKKDLGLDNFEMYEMNKDVGGTWLSNIFPGSKCDIPVQGYSFTFETRADWRAQYATQKEILNYIRELFEKYNLYPRLNFEHKVKGIVWKESSCQWEVTIENTKNGKEFSKKFDFVFNATGSLRAPNFPEQFLTFKGDIIHTSMWDETVELEGKRIAVVGTGASAIQVIPQVAKVAKKLVVYQRKPSWIIPKFDFEFGPIIQFFFRYIPFLLMFYQFLLYRIFELLWHAMKPDSWASKQTTAVCNYFRRKQLQGREDLYEKLTPKYIFGCQRTGFAYDYYPTFLQSNVSLVTSPIEEVTHDSIITSEGEEKFDVLVLATGFKVSDFFAPMEISDKNGNNVLKMWKEDGPSLFLGIAANELPNLFTIYGPNTSTGHNSVVKTIEIQLDWIVKCLKEMFKRKAITIAINKKSEKAYMDDIYSQIDKMVWSVGCSAWYSDKKGRIIGIYPGNLQSYQKRVDNFDLNTQLEFTYK